MSVFENNLIALSEIDSELEQSLRKIESNKLFEVFLPQGEPLENIQIVDHRDNTAINHSLDDIPKKLQEYEQYDNYHTLYFFGIGSGLFFQKLLQNVNHKKIYIFEPEIELIYIVMNLIDFSADILQKRLIIKLSNNINLYKIKKFIDRESSFYLKKYNLDIYSNYYDKYMDEIKRLNDVILLLFKHILQDKGDSLDDTLVGYKHSIDMMLPMFKQPSLSKVLNSVKKRKHAVLVSTGPSLEKQLPLLKKYQDYFTILSVDASFPVLYRAGIKPDIVLAMERVPQVANFFIDIPAEFQKDVVFMLATVCHDDAFKSLKEGAIICPYLRADTHNMALKLNDWGYIGGGLCGANYMFNFAVNAEFENLVFIGQDLAFSKDGSSHANGHVFGTDGNKIDEEFDGYLPAYGGDGEVATQKYWRLFLNDFVFQISYSKDHKNMEVYNATEGGARIGGTIEIPFKQYCEDILDTVIEKDQIDLKYPSEDEIKEVTLKYLELQNEHLKLIKSIKKKAKRNVKIVEKFLDKIKDLTDKEIIDKVKNAEIDSQLKKIYDVRNKYANPIFINAFSTLFMSYLSHLDFDIAAVKTMRENTSEAIKRKKINYIKVNYEWLYRLWGSLDKIIEILESSISPRDIK